MQPQAPLSRADDVELTSSQAPSSVASVSVRAEKRLFVEGADGFVAFDAQTGKALRGRPPGGRLRRRAAAPGAMKALSRVAARGVSGEQISFQAGPRDLSAPGPTGRTGEQRLALSDLDGLGSASVPLLSLDVRHGEVAPGQARVLALPASYDGPIFITDIDDTLRATKAGALLRGDVQPPLAGARELLEGVAAMGVPIVYLSAAPAQLHSVNQDFLKQLPPGILLDHPHYTADNLIALGGHQSEVQGDYKMGVLAELQSAFPAARLVQLGDDKYGDARAYNEMGGLAYIHNVHADQRFVPSDFQGVLVDHYHPQFRERVLTELGDVVQRSASLGGNPALPAAPRAPISNPLPIEKRSFIERMRDEVRMFSPHIEGGARGVGQQVLQRLDMHRDPLHVAQSLSDEELAALPPRGLAVLAAHLLADLDGKRYGSVDEACDLSNQFVRTLTARGTDRGSIDYILSKVDRADRLPDLLVGTARLTCGAHLQASPARPGDWAGWSRYLDQATATRAVPGAHVEPFVDGEKAFPAMLADIDGAKSSVNFCVFDFQSDEAGWQYARHLAAAAERGCEVRFIYDPAGSHHSNGMPTDPAIFDYLRERGVQVQAQKPGLVPNHMMHRKIVVCDGQVGYVGGMNVGDEYRDVWHDVHCRITGPAVSDLQAVYTDQWQRNGGELSDAQLRGLFPPLEPQGTDATTRLVAHDGRDDVSIHLAYLRAIDTAAESIQIATPYLTDPAVISHLCAAARRGVKVQVMVPQTNIHKLVQVAERSHHEEMRRAGIEVYEYHGRPMLHAKVATFDHRIATIGSSNLDAQSLQANDEINLWSDDRAVASKLANDFFAPSIAASDRADGHAPGPLGRIIEGAVAKAHPLL